MLEELGEIELPRDLRRLVEAATHRDALPPMTDGGAAWAQAWQSYINLAGRDQQVVDAVVIDFNHQYCYVTTKAIAAWLGDPTIAVRTMGFVSPLDGAALAEIGVPQH